MTAPLFHSAVFEMIDQWCNSVDARDYLGLLFAILGEVMEARSCVWPSCVWFVLLLHSFTLQW